MDEATIAALEQGHYKPESQELSQLAEALGVDELELLRRPAPGYLILSLPPTKPAGVLPLWCPSLFALIDVGEWHVASGICT